jgi:hypothetical protein
VLSIPYDNDYTIEWDSLDSETPSERADNVTNKLDLLQKYIDEKMGNFFSPIDFCIQYLGMKEDEATELITRATKYQSDQAALTAAAAFFPYFLSISVAVVCLTM